MAEPKLTEAQCRLLRDICCRERPVHVVNYYPPLRRLLALRLVREVRLNGYVATDAGQEANRG